MICTHCKIDRPIDQYQVYWHKNHQKHFTRRTCTPCMREGSRLYKQKKKLEKLQPTPVPVIPDDWKQCSDCMEYKPYYEYYKSRAGNPVKLCKVCYKKYHRDKCEVKMNINGGPDTYSSIPNVFTSEIQKEQVHMVMRLCGWIFDESTGVWNKPGLKENGVFINFISTDKPKRKSPAPGGGRKIKKGVWNNMEKIVNMLKEGYTYNDVADTFDCSHTLIRLVVTKYRNEQRS